MICLDCKGRLKCQETRSIGPCRTYREYGCLSCKKVYVSEEVLDTNPLNRKIHESRLAMYKRRSKDG